MRKLEIDPEFRDLLPALSEDEFNRLEEQIVDAGGCLDPIKIWGNTIIDGHNRYAIMQKHPELTKFKTEMMDFADRHEALYWILMNQLGRRNVDKIERNFLLNKALQERGNIKAGAPLGNTNNKGKKKSQLPSSLGINFSGHKHGTADDVGRDFNVSHTTVENASYFVKGVEAAESVSPGFEQKIRNKIIKAPDDLIRHLYMVPDDIRKDAVCAIERGDIKAAREITGVPVRKKRPSNTPPKTGPGSFVHELVETLGSEESTENGFIESEVPHISEDYITRMDRMFELHPEAVKSAEGKAVMIEHMTKVKNWIDERIEWYEQEGIS